MISRRQLPELRNFFRAEKDLPLRWSAEYANLVVPNGNCELPVHSWFKYKEAYSADLLGYVVGYLFAGASLPSRLRLLDPFCGVGTTLLSAQLLQSQYQIEAIGIDCSPFAAFVARSKLAWPRVDPDRLRKLASLALARTLNAPVDLPALSSIRTGRCISRHMAKHIVEMRVRIARLDSCPERDVLLTGLAACIEPVSRIRRDGRALRIVAKPRKIFRETLAQRWEAMADDVERLSDSRGHAASAVIYCADGRRPLGTGIADGTVDLIVTSPPYPNNIDYNEVYKLELWLLGFVKAPEGFLRLRRGTYRSHPTCMPADEEPDYASGFSEILREDSLTDLLGMVSRRAARLDRESWRGRSKVLLGYAYDTWRTLQAHRSALKPGGHAVYVVGNSLHGSAASRPYLVPTDLIFSRLAQLLGLEVEQVIVARPL